MQAHLNPDHYLQTPQGRVYTPERGQQAWAMVYQALDDALTAATDGTVLYVVCGLQGAGKTTWIRQNAPRLEPDAIFFDAALPARQHRARALTLAHQHGVPAVAVWINAPLAVAIRQNAMRPPDEQIPLETIQHVHDQMAPPSVDEGFARVMEVAVNG